MFSYECKMENNFIAHKKQITFKQAVLDRFQILLEKSKKVKNKRNDFGLDLMSCENFDLLPSEKNTKGN